MKKALLMTWFNAPNYGTLLQCDATVRLLKNRYDIDTMIPNYTPIGKRDFLSVVQKIFTPKTWRRMCEKIAGKKLQQKEKTGFDMKQKMVNDFIKRYSFALDGRLIKYDRDFAKLARQFDVFISGSDQIWNPDFLNERFLLDFVPNSKQCISVASSVSKKQIDDDFEDVFKKHLRKYKGITVREKDYVGQLKKISGKEVYPILDPTILLGAEQWKRLMIKPNQSGYILTYILGTSDAVRKEVVRISKREQKRMFYFPHMDGMYTAADEKLKQFGVPLWGEDPYKWIGWINDADIILTDSFHMTVFSIMLHKNFYVFPKSTSNPSQNNRIINILETTGLMSRFLSIEMLQQFTPQQDDIDWNVIDQKLIKERQSSLKCLDSVISTIDWSIVNG